MTNPQQLTSSQLDSFDEFLLDGTEHTLKALETVFELNIDCSNSSIEVAPTVQNRKLNKLGKGSYYVISSSLTGEVNGNIALFMHETDFKYFRKMMQPVLSLLFLSDSDLDLVELGSQMPDLTQNDNAGRASDTAYHAQMMDALAEMGNVLIGLYTKDIYKMCGLNTHHSVPEVMESIDQDIFQQVLLSLGEGDRSLIVIDNEIYLESRPVKLWCLISPARDSFRKILSGLDAQHETAAQPQQRRASWA